MPQAKSKVQRIKLQPEGSPVKYDATILESTPDGKRIRVEFDAPIDDVTMYAFGGNSMLSDMTDREGKPTDNVLHAVKSIQWRVI